MGGRWVSQELNPSYKFGADLQKLEMGEPQSLPVEGKRAGAARFGAERPDEGIGERAAPLLERDHGGKDFLLALDRDDVGLQHALDGGRDLGACKPVGAIEDQAVSAMATTLTNPRLSSVSCRSMSLVAFGD